MIIWSENLILGETIKKKHRKVIHAIKKGRWISGVYLIAYPSNPANLLDLIPAKELLFPIYKRSEIHILGLQTIAEIAILYEYLPVVPLFFLTVCHGNVKEQRVRAAQITAEYLLNLPILCL